MVQNDSIEYPTTVGDRVVESELIDLMKHVRPSNLTTWQQNLLLTSFHVRTVDQILEKDPKLRFTSQQIRVCPRYKLPTS